MSVKLYAEPPRERTFVRWEMARQYTIADNYRKPFLWIE